MAVATPQESFCENKVRRDKNGRILSPNFRKPTQKSRKAPKFLTEGQVENLIQAAYKNRSKFYRKRNALLVMMMFRHGLRRNEAVGLEWSQINLEDGQITIHRLKNGKMCVHPIKERELRMLREFKKICPSEIFVFTSHSGEAVGESVMRDVLKSLGKECKYAFTVHPHMLRHGCGYYLANKGVDTRAIQDYLGHQDIKKTVIYTEMAPNRFNNFWKE